MTTMGRHSPPLDGTVANGHVLVPLSMPLQPRGPVSALPQPDAGRWPAVRRAVSARRAWLAAVPVVLVNAVAFGAQLGFWRVHLQAVAEAVLVALALESVAVYLAWQAHLAQLADDAALRLRLSAYGFASVIGVLNYSHYMAPGWRPTVAAVTFGMMSAISPWLWSVHSRRVSRDALKAAQDIEPHAVRLGMTRWAWHPVRSWRVMFAATWAGVTKPAEAIAMLPGDRAAVDKPTPVTVDKPADKPQAKPPPRRAIPARTQLDKAADAIRRHPDWTGAALAKAAGVSAKTVQRARKGPA